MCHSVSLSFKVFAPELVQSNIVECIYKQYNLETTESIHGKLVMAVAEKST